LNFDTPTFGPIRAAPDIPKVLAPLSKLFNTLADQVYTSVRTGAANELSDLKQWYVADGQASQVTMATVHFFPICNSPVDNLVTGPVTMATSIFIFE
jgi:hypothetical protein